jgi:hypothetical protein
MSLRTSKDWNQFLVRFLIAFSFWEVIAFPLRILFFSKFYHSLEYTKFFLPIAEVYWLVPIAAEILLIFTLGALYYLCRTGLPFGLVGGLLFGALVSLFAFVSPNLILLEFTKAIPANLSWIWVLYLSLQVMIVSGVYSVSFSETELHLD